MVPILQGPPSCFSLLSSRLPPGVFLFLCSSRLSVPSFPLLPLSLQSKKEVHILRSGEGHGKPLQYSFLENPIDKGAWWAMVHRVAKSQTQLSNKHFNFFTFCWDENPDSLTAEFMHLMTTSSDQIRSVAQSCPTLCDPMNRRTPGLPVHHQLPEFTQTHVHRVSDAIQSSHPLSSPSPPAPNPSQHQSLFQ